MSCLMPVNAQLQVKVFGGYTRWGADVAPPDAATPARVALTTIDAAVRFARQAHSPGPVHLNCQFREPLVPICQPWPESTLRVRLASCLAIIYAEWLDLVSLPPVLLC